LQGIAAAAGLVGAAAQPLGVAVLEVDRAGAGPRSGQRGERAKRRGHR